MPDKATTQYLESWSQRPSTELKSRPAIQVNAKVRPAMRVSKSLSLDICPIIELIWMWGKFTDVIFLNFAPIFMSIKNIFAPLV